MNLLKQFANTYKEWHYLVAGFCMGYVTGWIGHAIIHGLLY